MTPGPRRALSLRIGAAVDTVVQVGRVVVRPATRGPGETTVSAPTLLGRADEVRRVTDALLDGRPGVVLHGPPGSGTTSIARAACAGHDVAWVALDRTDPAPEPAVVLRRVLRGLGLADHAVPADAEQRRMLVRSVLSARGTLLVLDGAGGEEQIRALSAGHSPCLVTMTGSPAGLAVDGWDLVPVPGLTVPDGSALLRQAAPGSGWTDDELAEIVARCSGRPRTLRLLGSAARDRASPADLLAELGDQDPAVGAARLAMAALPRHVLDVLDAALLAGRGDPEHAGTATGLAPGTIADALAELATAGLLDTDPVGRHYTVPTLLRRSRRREPADAAVDPPLPAAPPDAAGRPIEDSGTDAGISDAERLCLLAAEALGRAADAAGEAEQRLRLADLTVASGRPETALAHATRAAVLFASVGDHGGQRRAATATGEALLALGESGPAIRAFDMALDVPALAAGQRARALLGRGDAYRAAGSGARALADYRAGLGCCADPADRVLAVGLARRIAEECARLGDPRAAVEVLRRVVDELGDARASAALRLLEGTLRIEVDPADAAAAASAVDPDVDGSVGAPGVLNSLRTVLHTLGAGGELAVLLALVADGSDPPSRTRL